MLSLLRTRPGRSKCDGFGRREFLRVGSLGVAGLTLADLLRLRAFAAPGSRKPVSVILLFLDGGASQHETFDPKLGCPVEYRSLFGAVQTKIPGVMFGGQLPKMAAHADRMAIIRTLEHTDGDHAGATHWIKTGRPWPPQFVGKPIIIPQTSPSIGSIFARALGPNHPETRVPRYVRVQRDNGYPGDDASWLGAAYAPLRVKVGDEKSSPLLDSMTLKIDQNRLADRRSLLAGLDRLDRRLDKSGTMDAIDDFDRQAIDVVLGRGKEAFDLSKEDQPTRDLYGPGLGQELLLARRLCEMGAGFVTLNHGYWDHHSNIIPGLKKTTPPLDHVVTAYIEDVTRRGVFDDILLVISGDFGRTPRINGGPGRDHWAAINDAVFIGGGLKMGQTIGTTDAKAAVTLSRPVTMQEYTATLLHALGVPLDLQYTDPAGRPQYMVDEKPIAELI
ncbi:MAG: DUF1501 domain-containing protein [Planctomycetaceae bacterium]